MTSDPFNPAVPSGAYDDLLARALPAAWVPRRWEPADPGATSMA